MSGYDVDPEELRSAARSIDTAVGKADDVKLEGLVGSKEAFGHGGVATALTEFCTTWQLATGLLQESGRGAGQSLDGAAGTYEQADEQNTMRSVPGPGPQVPPM
ncbi:Excreted virulence factor EspC, type VII ESX diderm [Prauserella aidingensis]|uniref:WXG100 family type VII secretion target n=1 Tax=Prauserella aidingensis TaxID=387890 RepID=UPI0020A3C2EB|nr:type VII secretion target [Prauserella aidingensis]MCP2252027.1 Excreted virulence factor EspC, type VII ESX diderm [Prauserella aidingensis]